MSVIKSNQSGLGGSGDVGGALGSFYSYTLNQSLRFVDDSSTVLHRTPSSASNRKTWSFSCWIKLSTLQDDSSRNFSIFSAGSNVYNRRVDVGIGSGYQLMFFMDGRADGASYYSFIADRFLRDTSAWMHIVAVMDTTDSTADDRLKLYVNGERQSGAYQYGHGAPPLNSDWYVNSTYEHDIGDGHHDSVVQFFDGYIAEVNFIDGTALDATSFGEQKTVCGCQKNIAVATVQMVSTYRFRTTLYPKDLLLLFILVMVQAKASVVLVFNQILFG